MANGSDKAADEREIGSPIPPYDGRTTSAAAQDDPNEPDERKQRSAGVGPGMHSSATDPASTPGGRDASPADEVPAEQVRPTRPEADPGVGPAHVPGSGRAEDVGKGSEPGRRRTGETDDTGRPVGTSDARDKTGIAAEKEDPNR